MGGCERPGSGVESHRTPGAVTLITVTSGCLSVSWEGDTTPFPARSKQVLKTPVSVRVEPAPCASYWGLLTAPGLIEFQTAMQPCQAYFPSYARVHLEDLLNPLHVRPGCVLTCCLNFPCLLRDSRYLWLGKPCLISWLFLLVFRCT